MTLRLFVSTNPAKTPYLSKSPFCATMELLINQPLFMDKLEQKTIEQYFQEFQVVDEAAKEKILLRITDLVYDRNRHAVEHESATDEYRKQQLANGVKELEDKIVEIIKENK